DVTSFAEHVARGGAGGVVEFANLSRDAILVVPCPRGPPSAYGHIGAFVRQAPEAQRHALWQMVGDTMQRRLNDQPVWSSTAGAGDPCVHVRLDDRPKYYGCDAYREMT